MSETNDYNQDVVEAASKQVSSNFSAKPEDAKSLIQPTYDSTEIEAASKIIEPEQNGQTNGILWGGLTRKETRKHLFEHLETVLNLSRAKIDKQTSADSAKQKWSRILIEGARAYGEIMKVTENELLEERVARLEMRRR